jgi:very-short-patch-repair endonuclease
MSATTEISILFYLDQSLDVYRLVVNESDEESNSLKKDTTPNSPLEGWLSGAKTGWSGSNNSSTSNNVQNNPVNSFSLNHEEPARPPATLQEGSLGLASQLVPGTKTLFDFLNLPKNPALKQRAKELRHAGVLSEVLFWQAFNNKKILGWDIDRQVIIGNYIVDFFIPELGLIFEIDGESHDFKGEYDVQREIYLQSLGLQIVHIPDRGVKKEIDAVCELVLGTIKLRVRELNDKKSTPSSLRSATPQEGNFGTTSLNYNISKIELSPIFHLEREAKTLNLTDKFADIWNILTEQGYFHYSRSTTTPNSPLEGWPEAGVDSGAAITPITTIYFWLTPLAGFTDTRILYLWLKSWQMFDRSRKFYNYKLENPLNLENLNAMQLQEMVQYSKEADQELLYSAAPRIG